MLFGCIHAPDFPVQAALRTESLCHGEVPVAVLDGPDSLLKVFACNQAARLSGVEPGMTRLQAEACAELVIRKRQPAQEESAQQALLDCGIRFSPHLESTAPGTVIVDLTGTERLFGSAHKLGRELARCAENCGFEVNVGIAANPDASLHAARGFSGISILPAGEESVRLGPLPVEVLQPPEEILDVLDSWGIRDFRALAALPAVPITERLGQQGLHLQRLASGKEQRELAPAAQPLCFRESIELEESVELLEPLAFVLNRLLDHSMARLQARSLATDMVELELALEIHPDRQLEAASFVQPESFHRRTLKLHVPTQETKILLKLLQLDLAAHPPSAPVKKITLELQPARLRHMQTGLFQSLAPEPGKLEIALARLRAVTGEQDEQGRGRVGSPAVADSHQPDSFLVLPFVSGAAAPIGECLPSPRLALRLFRPPLPALVELRNEAPAKVIFNGSKSEVLDASGPWRGSGEWWRTGAQWRREEWDLALSMNGNRGLFRLFRDLTSGRWFVEGMYD